MRTSLMLVTAAASMSGAAAIDWGDVLGDTLTDCSTCLLFGGDGDCTDECDVLGAADDAVNLCCEWWSCNDCPTADVAPATTTKAPTKVTTTAPKKRTTTRKHTTTHAPKTTTKKHTTTHAPTTTTNKHTTTLAPTTTAIKKRTTTHAKPTTTTKQSRRTTTAGGSPVVATIYEDAQCSGKSMDLTEADFAGGQGDEVWDTCGAYWSDGTAISSELTNLRRSGLGSVIVAEGYTVAASTECNDGRACVLRKLVCMRVCVCVRVRVCE
jgi:hypothetical protein